MKMALTRDYKDTVVARIKRDPKFARALYAEAVGALLEGETAEGLSMLRDLVRADKAVRAPGGNRTRLHTVMISFSLVARWASILAM